MTDAGTSLMGAFFKGCYNVCHYISYFFSVVCIIYFMLFWGRARENHCLFYRAVRGLILSACSFLFSACNSDPATSQLLQS